MENKVSTGTVVDTRTNSEKLEAWRARKRQLRATGNISGNKLVQNRPRILPLKPAPEPVREHAPATPERKDPPPSETPTPNVAAAPEGPTQKAKGKKRLSFKSWETDGRKAKAGRRRSFEVFKKNMRNQHLMDEKRKKTMQKRKEIRERKAQEALLRKEQKEHRQKRKEELALKMRERRRQREEARWENQKRQKAYGQDAKIAKRVNATTLKIHTVRDVVRFRKITVKINGCCKFTQQMPILFRISAKGRQRMKRAVQTQIRKRCVANMREQQLYEKINPKKRQVITRSGRVAFMGGQQGTLGREAFMFHQRCE